MSKIEIKIDHTKSVNKQIKQLSSKLTDSKISLSMIRHHVDSKVAHRRNIGQRLNDAVTRINVSEKRLQELYQCIDHSMDLYIKAEKRVQSLKLAEIEKKSIWDTVKDSVKGFGKGLGTAVVSTVEGIWHAFTHPVETIKGTIHVITHPIETGKAIWKSISDSWKKDVVNGDAESRSVWFGRAFGEVALAIVGTKGVDKGVKLVKGSEILSNEVGAVRIGRASVDVEDKKSVINSKGYNGTWKIDYNLTKDYIRDVELKTGLKFNKAQIEQLKSALRLNNYEKLTPMETIKHRNKFNNVKDKLINEWEEKTGHIWPRYIEVVYDKNRRVVRDIGQPFDAHHIIENNFGGPHEWWNIHPAKFPDEHQAGIHGKGSPANKLFPRR